MDQEIRDLKKEMSNLHDEVKELRKDIQNLLLVCGRMDNHISFVDSVYDSIRNPLQILGRKLFYGFNMPPQNVLQLEDSID